MIDVSIVIINYNNDDLTYKCIESVIAKTKKIKYEIILVDNGSKSFDFEFFRTNFSGLKIIKNDENVGFAKGNNMGIQHACANTILLLNNDVILINDAISVAYDKLHRHKDIGVVGGQLQYPDGTVQHNAGRFPSLRLTLLELFRIDRLLPAKKRGTLFLGFHFDHKSETEVDWLWGAFFMIKKDVINLLPKNKLPDHFFMYGEDLAWGYAIKKLGYSLMFSPEPKVIHLLSQSNFSKIKEAINLNKRATIRSNKGPLFSILFEIIYFLHQSSLAIEKRIKRIFK